MQRRVGLQNDVAAFLMYYAIAPVAAQNFDQLRSAQVAGHFHALARTSSRTKCRRMRRETAG